jgi:hypothetical protein
MNTDKLTKRPVLMLCVRLMSFTTCPDDVTCVSDFCRIFVLHTITMNQKSSVVQVMHSVQLVLSPDTKSSDVSAFIAHN